MNKISNTQKKKSSEHKYSKRKYIGNIYDGRWEVVSVHVYKLRESGSRQYTLRNIYNDMEITLKDVTLRKIDRGETTLSKVLSTKIQHQRKGKKVFEW